MLILFQFFLTTRKEALRSHLGAKESLRTLILKISETILSGIGCLKVSREATRFRLNITDAFTTLSLASNKMPSFHLVWISFWFISRGIYIYVLFCIKVNNTMIVMSVVLYSYYSTAAMYLQNKHHFTSVWTTFADSG